MKKDGVCRKFVRSRRYVITEVADHVNRHFPGIDEKAAQNRTNRVGLELETSNHAKISASAAPDEAATQHGVVPPGAVPPQGMPADRQPV